MQANQSAVYTTMKSFILNFLFKAEFLEVSKPDVYCIPANYEIYVIYEIKMFLSFIPSENFHSIKMELWDRLNQILAKS